MDLVADEDTQQLLYDEMEKKGVSGLDQIHQLRHSRANSMLADIRKAMTTGFDLNALAYQGVAAVRDCVVCVVCVGVCGYVCVGGVGGCRYVCVGCGYVCVWGGVWVCVCGVGGWVWVCVGVGVGMCVGVVCVCVCVCVYTMCVFMYVCMCCFM